MRATFAARAMANTKPSSSFQMLAKHPGRRRPGPTRCSTWGYCVYASQKAMEYIYTTPLPGENEVRDHDSDAAGMEDVPY